MLLSTFVRLALPDVPRFKVSTEPAKFAVMTSVSIMPTKLIINATIPMMTIPVTPFLFVRSLRKNFIVLRSGRTLSHDGTLKIDYPRKLNIPRKLAFNMPSYRHDQQETKMEKKFVHGPELREFWRVQKAKYRERKRIREVQAANSTASLTRDSTPQMRGEPDDRRYTDCT